MFGVTGLSVALVTSQGGSPVELALGSDDTLVLPVVVISTDIVVPVGSAVVLVGSLLCDAEPSVGFVVLAVSEAEPELEPDSETVDRVVGIVIVAVIVLLVPLPLPSSEQPTCSMRAVRTREERPSELATLRIALTP